MVMNMKNTATEHEVTGPDVTLSNEALVARIKTGDTELFELLMRRLNRRLYLVALSILHNEAEAEEVLQEAYLRGWQNLDSFRGPAGIGAWFTRIVRNEALMRIRKHKRYEMTDVINISETLVDETASPETDADLIKTRHMLELAIGQLPQAFRLTFVLREIEQLSVKETADSLDIDPATVKTRVYRARQLLREKLGEQLSMPASEAFPFAGYRCDRIVASVMRRISALDSNDSSS